MLNLFGFRVQAGKHFSSGDYVSGIYFDCDLKLIKFEKSERKVLRVIVSYKFGRFLDDPLCMEVPTSTSTYERTL